MVEHDHLYFEGFHLHARLILLGKGLQDNLASIYHIDALPNHQH